GKGGQFVGEQIEKIPGFNKLQEAVQGATGISVPRVNMNEVFSGVGSPNKSIGGEIAKGVGQYLPYGVAGGASLLPEMEAIAGSTRLKTLGKSIANTLANSGQVAAGATAGTALTDPEEKNFFDILPRGKTGGALEGALLNLLTGGVLKGLEAL